MTFNKCHANEWKLASMGEILFIFFSPGWLCIVWPMKAENHYFRVYNRQHDNAYYNLHIYSCTKDNNICTKNN